MLVSDPFFRLPTELCCAILRDWLYLESVVRLDSAVCNAEKRSSMWNAIFESSQCVLSLGQTYDFYEKDLFNWLCFKPVRASGLYFTRDVDNTVIEYFRSFGASIRKLDLWNCRATDYLSLISAHCSRIVCLSFAETNYLFLPSDVELLSCTLKALDLGGTKITDSVLEQIAKRCPILTHICVSDCVSLSDNCGNIIGSNLKHLQFLDIGNNDILTDNVLVKIAEHNYDTLEVIHMEEMFGFGLMALLKKCTKLRSAFITYHEGYFENFEFALLCDLTELSITNLNESLSYLITIVTHCKRLKRFMLNVNTYRYSRSDQFRLRELTIQRLPDLKVLAPFGVPKKEIEEFSLMRPEVEIISFLGDFDPTIYCMKW